MQSGIRFLFIAILIAIITTCGAGYGVLAQGPGRGAELYAEHCADCHGITGAGDGEFALSGGLSPTRLSDPEFAAGTSPQEVFDVISNGRLDRRMPPWADVLSEDEMWDLTDYILGLSDITPQPTITQEPIQETATTTISVHGNVLNGTSGGEVPENLPIELYIFRRDGSLVDVLETQADENGTYGFTDVPFIDGGFFFPATSYNDIDFGGAFARFQAGQEDVEASITIYETTDDPSVISIQSIQLDLQFGSEAMTVGQVMQFANSSDRVYITDKTVDVEGEDRVRHVSLEVPLPPGAFGLAFQVGTGRAGVRYHFQDGVLMDTMAVRPGTDHELAFSYMLPYEDGAIIEWEMPYKADNIHLFLPDVGITLTSDQFQNLGSMGDAPYTVYMAGPIGAGEILRYELSGHPRRLDETSTPSEGPSGALVGAAVALAVIAITLAYMFLSGRIRRPVPETGPIGEADGPESESISRRDELIQAIAELDDKFERGEIPQEEYQAKRRTLKEELSNLMRGEQ